MRRYPNSSASPQAPIKRQRGDWDVVKTLLPYLWTYKWRVMLALAFLVGAKLANVGVPLVLKKLVDAMTITASHPQALLVLPLGLLVAYGVLRLATALFTELRELMFARVTQRAVRTIALQVFRHLHALSLRFHLNRQTGGMTRDIERGTRGVSTLVSYTLFSILPTIIEIVLVLAYVGKVLGATLGARIGGMGRRHSWAVGFGMNARGAMEIILGTLALNAGLISKPIFEALVIMALITSLTSGPLMKRFID